MQDDQKRPTVEDQELANMIANLNGGGTPPAPVAAPTEPAPTPPVAPPTPAPGPISSLPPIPPKTDDNPTSSLPPIPPKTTNDPAPGLPPVPSKAENTNPAPLAPSAPSSDPNFTIPTDAGSTATNFKDIKPTPGLPPLPTNPSANAPALPPLPPAPSAKPASQPAPNLTDLKQKTLEELRPLVAKLDLSPEEKFDTLLLLIRSTDDPSLIAEAHEAAEKITDETRRASALLDVVKEIDYFENNK